MKPVADMSDEQIEAVSVAQPPPQYQKIVVADYWTGRKAARRLVWRDRLHT